MMAVVKTTVKFVYVNKDLVVSEVSFLRGASSITPTAVTRTERMK